MSPFCAAVLVAVALFLIGGTSADDAGDREVEQASLSILNAAGDFIDVVQSVKITDVTLQGDNKVTGRGSKKLMRMAIPLIVGFKLAGIIVAAMTALKVLVLKTVVMSGLAIIASLALAAKQLYDKMKEKKAMAQEGFAATPYFYPGMAASADLSWDPNNAAGYEIHGLGAAGAGQDLSHFGTDFQASYAASPLSAAGTSGAATALGNGTAFGFVPGTHYIPVAERKSHVRPPMYRTTLYKTVIKED